MSPPKGVESQIMMMQEFHDIPKNTKFLLRACTSDLSCTMSFNISFLLCCMKIITRPLTINGSVKISYKFQSSYVPTVYKILL